MWATAHTYSHLATWVWFYLRTDVTLVNDVSFILTFLWHRLNFTIAQIATNYNKSQPWRYHVRKTLSPCNIWRNWSRSAKAKFKRRKTFDRRALFPTYAFRNRRWWEKLFEMVVRGSAGVWVIFGALSWSVSHQCHRSCFIKIYFIFVADRGAFES